MILRYNLLSILFLFYFNSCDKSSIAPETIEDLEVQIEELMEDDASFAQDVDVLRRALTGSNS